MAPAALLQWASQHNLCGAPEARRAFDILRQASCGAGAGWEQRGGARPGQRMAGRRGPAGWQAPLVFVRPPPVDHCTTLSACELQRALQSRPSELCMPLHAPLRAAQRERGGARGPAAAAGGHPAEPPWAGVPAGCSRVPGTVRAAVGRPSFPVCQTVSTAPKEGSSVALAAPPAATPVVGPAAAAAAAAVGGGGRLPF